MSTEHPLTEEQLDALVDEIQDRLGDSTARTYGRRGVLAALGVAALGTGSASAQASGTVGTASNPVDVEGYDVTADNSFTDPAGVTHSGELADISDVGASGQWQEVNSGSNIEPIDGETVGTGVEDVDVGSVSTDEISETLEVRNGDTIQSQINALPNGGGEIVIRPSYDESQETLPITVRLKNKPLTIRGAGPVAFNPDNNISGSELLLDFTANSTDNVFEFYGTDTNGNSITFAPALTVSNIGVAGGNNAFVFSDITMSNIHNLYATKSAGDGFLLNSPDNTTLTSNNFANCFAYDVGGAGFNIPAGVNAYATNFRGCAAYYCGEHGLLSRGSPSTVWIGGFIAKNGDYGASLISPGATVMGAYIEENQQTTGQIADIRVRSGVTGCRILHNFFTSSAGGLTVDRGVLINSGDKTLVDGNSFQGYSQGFFQSSSGNDNILGVNNIALDSTALLRSDGATRTRYGSIIGGGPLGGVDLSSTTGRFSGDRAIADGTSTATAGALARWNGSSWQYHDPTGTV